MCSTVLPFEISIMEDSNHRYKEPLMYKKCMQQLKEIKTITLSLKGQNVPTSSHPQVQCSESSSSLYKYSLGTYYVQTPRPG